MKKFVDEWIFVYTQIIDWFHYSLKINTTTTMKKPTSFFSLSLIPTIAIAITSLVSAPNANATLLAYEGFNYSGSLLNSGNDGNSGFGWSTNWKSVTNLSTNSAADLNGSSLSAPIGYPTNWIAGGSMRLQNPGGQTVAARGIAAPARIDLSADQTIYFSFLAEKTSGGIAVDFRQGNSTIVLQLGVSTGGAVTMNLAGETTTSGTLIANNFTYLYVGKVVGSSTGPAEAYFTRYATSQTIPSSEPESWLLSAMTADSSTLFADRISFSGGSNRTVTFDEIRIGTSWDAVAVPEPATVALGLGILSLLVVMLRRRGQH